MKDRFVQYLNHLQMDYHPLHLTYTGSTAHTFTSHDGDNIGRVTDSRWEGKRKFYHSRRILTTCIVDRAIDHHSVLVDIPICCCLATGRSSLEVCHTFLIHK